MFKIGLSIETANRLVVAKDWVLERNAEIANGHRVSFLGYVNVLELDSGDQCTPF